MTSTEKAKLLLLKGPCEECGSVDILEHSDIIPYDGREKVLCRKCVKHYWEGPEDGKYGITITVNNYGYGTKISFNSKN